MRSVSLLTARSPMGVAAAALFLLSTLLPPSLPAATVRPSCAPQPTNRRALEEEEGCSRRGGGWRGLMVRGEEKEGQESERTTTDDKTNGKVMRRQATQEVAASQSASPAGAVGGCVTGWKLEGTTHATLLAALYSPIWIILSTSIFFFLLLPSTTSRPPSSLVAISHCRRGPVDLLRSVRVEPALASPHPSIQTFFRHYPICCCRLLAKRRCWACMDHHLYFQSVLRLFF